MSHRPSSALLGPLLLVLAWITLPLHAADWSAYRADAQRSGYTSDALPQSLAPRWVYRLAHAPRPAWPSSTRMTFDNAAQPIVVGDTVLLGSSAGDKVVALDAAAGDVRWQFLAGGPIRFSPVAWRDRVFVACDDGFLYALSLADGVVLWRSRGGPNDQKCLGNERLISRWPARGGPVVFDDTVYYAAGIWPSDGVYLHALDAESGAVVWTNDKTGRLSMPQPHGTAMAKSGVSPQGYLVATEKHLIVPTGRAVPAVFNRQTGELLYYHLQANGSIGGSRVFVADRFFAVGGCLFEPDTGLLAARCGRGVLGASADGILQTDGHTLVAYRWADQEKPDRKGRLVSLRGLEQCGLVQFSQQPPDDQAVVDRAIQAAPALRDLYDFDIRFKQTDDRVPGQTGLERILSMQRPTIERLGADANRFLAAAYERTNEVIAAGGEAVCGGENIVRVVDLQGNNVRWTHPVEGAALGLAVARGQLIVSTSAGVVYCFADPSLKKGTGSEPLPARPATNTRRDVPVPLFQVTNFDPHQAAQQILQLSNVHDGFCVDLSCGSGQLALELAQQSNLYVVTFDADQANVATARTLLDKAGLLGVRATVLQGDPSGQTCPAYLADLLLSSKSIATGSPAIGVETVQRLQRPQGGVVCQGPLEAMTIQVRGPLEGAGSWTHQNADAANTLCSSDTVRGPLEMLWFRDGVIEIPDRHAQAPAPLVHGGTLVVEGVDGLCGLDAYNGRTLWTFGIEGILADQDGVHHDVGVGDTGGNFCLDANHVYVRHGDTCFRIHQRKGRLEGQFTTPVAADEPNRAWGYIACEDRVLYGSVLNDEHKVSPRYDDIRLRTESTLFFAMDAQTGELLWKYQPEHSIRNNAIAVADGRVYLIDRVLALGDRVDNPNRDNGKQGPLLERGVHPGGVLVALDGRTGETLWRQDDDVWGTQLAVSREHALVVMFCQAVKHGFFKLPSEVPGRLAAFQTTSGERVWQIEAEFVTRPILAGDRLYAEGGAWDIRSGAPLPWEFERSYGCGQIASGKNLLLFRSATLGYLDLSREAGTENYGGVRPSCWFSAVPAAGLVLVPDGSLKCACSYQMQAWFALREREEP